MAWHLPFMSALLGEAADQPGKKGFGVEFIPGYGLASELFCTAQKLTRKALLDLMYPELAPHGNENDEEGNFFGAGVESGEISDGLDEITGGHIVAMGADEDVSGMSTANLEPLREEL